MDKSHDLGNLNTNSIDSNYASMNTQRIFTKLPNGAYNQNPHQSFGSNDSYVELAGPKPMLNQRSSQVLLQDES